MKKSLLIILCLCFSVVLFGSSFRFYEIPTASFGSMQYNKQGYTVNFGTYTITALYVSPAQHSDNIIVSGVQNKTVLQYSISLSGGDYKIQSFLRRLYENW